MLARRAIAVALSGCALVLVAFVFDASPLFVPGVALLLSSPGAASVCGRAARGADAQRVLSAERVVEEQPLEASIEVRRGRLGLPGAEVIDPFTGSRLDLAGPLSTLRGDRRASVRVVTHFSRRGLHSLARLPRRFRSARARPAQTPRAPAPAQKLLVLPRTEPVRWLTSAGGRRFDQPDGHASSEAQAAVDMDGLRPYRPGTPASRIHWPAVARGAGLIERRLQADGDSRPLIVLDARNADPDAPPELLDAAVRAAASLALDLARRGGCGLLLPGEQRATAIDRELLRWPAAHARLAMVAWDPPTQARAPNLGPAAGRLGATIYVAAAPRPASGPSSRLRGGSVAARRPDCRVG